MKVGIMQPYFMPYIGYFQLIAAVDKYVVFDDVNYIKRGWAARNNLIIGGEKRMFHIELSEASQNKHFNEIIIKDDFTKLRKTLQMNYSKAAYYHPTMELMENIFSYEDKRLSHFIANSFRQILSYLSINTEIVMSSDIKKDNSLRGQEKILEICKLLDADTYYNAIGGQELYDRQIFEHNAIKLGFIRTLFDPYPQFSKEFVPALSMIDILMMNSKEGILNLLSSYIVE